MGDALGAIGRSFRPLFEDQGLDLVEVAFGEADALARLTESSANRRLPSRSRLPAWPQLSAALQAKGRRSISGKAFEFPTFPYTVMPRHIFSIGT
jgi:hypothetical protein